MKAAFEIELLVCLFVCGNAFAQSVQTEMDPKETPGQRPYEMIWANRTEPAAPTLRFDDLRNWTLRVEDGAQAKLQVTRMQNVWDRPVARLSYRGEGKKEGRPQIMITLSQAMPIVEGADSVDMWVYGNRWDWENPPGTPPVRILLHLRDGAKKEHSVAVDTVRWKEWWLMHRRLPSNLATPVKLERIEITGGWQNEWREIFFDSIRFYAEQKDPLRFKPRPVRNVKLFDEQSPGANMGPGKLPFPTREETILPMHFGGPFKNRVKKESEDYTFSYSGKDGELIYRFNAAAGLSSLAAELNGSAVARLFDGAAVRLSQAREKVELKTSGLNGDVVTAEYNDGTTVRLRIWQKSLVVDFANLSGQATELSFGRLSGVQESRTIWVPYLTYGGGAHPCVLVSKAGKNHAFTSIWLDWYRSNGSEPYALESATNSAAQINGGVRYHPRTDGKRNSLFERVFITVSPVFEEVLPSVPNPVGLHAKEAVDRLWQESWGPDDFEKEMKRSRMLRAYGIEKLIQCNHEIAWRDGGESFTLRTRAAPKKGGDDALKKYVAHQRGLDWLAGLYSNYTDYAPVNEFWTPDGVQRGPDGNWRSAWPRCWAEKPLKAVEFDAILAPQIKAKYNPNSAYTDVHTAVAPWHYNDYDDRVPGAATFAQTFYAYGELLRNDSKVYNGPIFSEGTYHWLYAGLADGNYALAYDGRPLAREPLLPVFDLYQIHTKECDIGMGWTANFCDAIPKWKDPANLDQAIDRFLLHTLAYGHIGWLVEETHGIARTCRSYYMLQQVQAQYGLKAPKRIGYWDGTNLCTVSEALVKDLPRTRRQLMVEYPGGLQLWMNDHPAENWHVRLPSALSRESINLPPAGWVAWTEDGKLFTFSALQGKKVDYLRSPSYTFLDGRGQMFATAEATSNGGLAISKISRNELQVIKTSGEGPFTIYRPYKVAGALLECQAYDVEGKALASPKIEDTGTESRIESVDKAVRYVLKFGRKR